MPKRFAAWAAALLVTATFAWAAPDEAANIEHVRVLARADAARGDAGAKAYLEMLEGKGDQAAKDAASLWLITTAKRGRPEAQHQLGVMYEMVDPPKPERGVEWHLKAAEQGYVPAQMHLAGMYVEGRGVPRDNAKAIEWATKAAQRGDMGAQAWLGAKYYLGEIVPKDGPRAVEWLDKAARQGHLLAMTILAGIYQNGTLVPADPVKAKYWLDKVGGEMKAGKDSPADVVRGKLVAAAEGGDLNAQGRLGWSYLTGNGGFAKDGPLAVRWLTRAADAGNAFAQVNLASAYIKGEIVPKDEARAAKLYRSAADQGDHVGQYRLGRMYETGRGGLKQDRAAAFDLYRKAARQGDKDAIERLKAIDKR